MVSRALMPTLMSSGSAISMGTLGLEPASPGPSVTSLSFPLDDFDDDGVAGPPLELSFWGDSSPAGAESASGLGSASMASPLGSAWPFVGSLSEAWSLLMWIVIFLGGFGA